MVLPVSNPTKSFWIEEASSELRNFRSTEELPNETDVIIVGSGYSGATTAYWLNKVKMPIGLVKYILNEYSSIRKMMPKNPKCSC
ncbi:unnamed protein product [Penicillium salamii]|nr:unnamed protein product [Penicillium salamii]CAG8402729.1 unnamed protein product [Penicillium salamii]CAG8407043.1 unnamed protein product [Penicillium salamii]